MQAPRSFGSSKIACNIRQSWFLDHKSGDRKFLSAWCIKSWRCETISHTRPCRIAVPFAKFLFLSSQKKLQTVDLFTRFSPVLPTSRPCSSIWYLRKDINVVFPLPSSPDIHSKGGRPLRQVLNWGTERTHSHVFFAGEDLVLRGSPMLKGASESRHFCSSELSTAKHKT